ncbi:hypothetical protein GCWU000325_00245 [Alloprevotella tannerae ATCC 51259]|uniref:Uncharacterized protein n=1 Tax=Alloprevotella tannerae ATCC 51259 TaxID=626522 RepID=C9LDH5_9BACT|nr:hypothetical protein GCWU000325_00245 [Alloprevotella tannerae ATCC 51259]
MLPEHFLFVTIKDLGGAITNLRRDTKSTISPVAYKQGNAPLSLNDNGALFIKRTMSGYF